MESLKEASRERRIKKKYIDCQPDDYFRQIQMISGVLSLHIDKDEKCTIDVPKTY